MGDVLDQNEVDALLAAVEGGEIELPVESGAGAPPSRAPRLAGTASAYDFKRPEPVSKDQMRGLEVLHETFARNLASVLSGRLRHIVELRLETIDQLTYSEFTLSLPNPTCYNVLAGEPLAGNLVLEIHPEIVFPLLELLMGAAEVSPQVPERALTELETPIVRDMIDRALDQLDRVWAPVQPLKFRVVSTESNPQIVQLHGANEPVVLLTFQIAIGDHTGRMNLCYPFVAIEPLMPGLGAHAGFGKGKREVVPAHRAHLEDGLSLVQVDARALLVETTIRLSELMELEPGDVIATDRPATAPALLLVENRPKFWVRPGTARGKRAVEVQGICLPTDHV